MFYNNILKWLRIYLNIYTQIHQILYLYKQNINGPIDLSSFFKLKILDCSNNTITHLDNLPNTLIKLYCSGNKIITLNILPQCLMKFYCSNNNLIGFNNLPLNLIEFYCAKK